MGVLSLIGFFFLLWIFYQIYQIVMRYTKPGLSLQTQGSWAIVTGATDGIGRGFCQELGKQGLNVILVSRSHEKLESVAKEIEESFDVKTKILAIDFTKDKDIQERVEAEIKDLNIGVLINNVGVSYDHPEYFLQIENGPEKCRDIVQCNILSTLDMTRAVLPGMVTRGSGVVINLSSFLAYGGPLLSVYAASKAFVRQFSEDLEVEYKNKGVKIMCVAPYYVASKMSKIKTASWSIPSSNDYSSSVLKQVGLVTTGAGYWSHDLISTIYRALGSYGREKLFGFLKNIRAKALKKKLHHEESGKVNKE